jgi:hypothetical protein
MLYLVTAFVLVVISAVLGPALLRALNDLGALFRRVLGNT